MKRGVYRAFFVRVYLVGAASPSKLLHNILTVK